MASFLLGPPKDEHGNVKKIPKVAVYVAGAAFAVTTGLTLLVLPFVKQAAKMNNHTQFMSNRNLGRPVARAIASAPAGASAPVAPASTPAFQHDRRSEPLGDGPTTTSSSSATATTGLPTSRLVPPHFEQASHTTSPILQASSASPSHHPPIPAPRDKRFNDDEERSLYGALEGEHEYVSPWLGAQALGLATALVMGSAALGMWGVAKAMGVKTMDEFASKMRETLLLKMPALSEALSKQLSEEEEEGSGLIPVDHEGTRSIEGGDGGEGMSWSEVWSEIVRSGEPGDTTRQA